MNLIDAHNHLASASLAPHRAQIFADLSAAGVTCSVVNGTDETDWPLVAALAHEHSQIVPGYGLHPWDVGNRSPDWLASLRSYLDGNPRAMVGEIGLDRWMLDRARPDDPRLAGLRRAPLDEQLSVFKDQLALAARSRRAVTIHCIDAFGLLLETLHEAHQIGQLSEPGFLLHAYSGSVEMMESFVGLGAYFSFNGAYLATRHARLREMFRQVPVDRLLVETDAPAMRLPPEHEKFPALVAPDGSPVNHPANLAASYAALAKIRGLTLADLANQVEENFRRLFG